jgi:hypothetical protein
VEDFRPGGNENRVLPRKAGISTTALSRAEEKQFSPRTFVYRGRNVLEVYQRWLGE